MEFSVWIMVGKSPAEVYEAVADPAILSRFFTTGGAEGRMESGATVIWDFADFPGRFPVHVTEARKPERIAFRWDSGDDSGEPYETEVVFAFEPIDDGARTKVTVTESGWRDNETAQTNAFGKCMGWSQMLAALKTWTEHGINLREGAYR